MVGFLGGTSGQKPVCQCRRQKMWVRSLGWDDPLEGGYGNPPVFLPGETHGQRNLAGYSLGSQRVRHN